MSSLPTVCLDDKGRVRLPARIRKLLDWRPGDYLAITLVGDEVQIKKEIFPGQLRQGKGKDCFIKI
ncbi:hypothetical protein MGLY_01870 [Neomoorella glycerini]|uniref:SpoVT-AbrB domain-containing protein n=1 Tax=Neomoorella glycerini TaxID=55779 RepID=A0A6I5ZMN4_9FIRM|nr:AbrB/MazE/SpoVT family DNA-binding domain-containing protein [Moorella glycerini]QGP90875.1 hypothetical protein MGLY_01870 [Moorella glycerini]